MGRIKRPPVVEPIWPHERGLRGKRTKARTTLNSQRPSTSFILQRSCSFLNLPRELRDEIYHVLLPSYTTLCFMAPTWAYNAAGRFFSMQCNMSQYCLTVLGLCQQIHAEANAVLYGTNRFEFSIGHGEGPSPFNTIRALPQFGVSQIKACTVSVCAYPWAEKRQLKQMREWMDDDTWFSSAIVTRTLVIHWLQYFCFGRKTTSSSLSASAFLLYFLALSSCTIVFNFAP